MTLVANIINIAKRLTPWQKNIEVFSNDVDNAYPERVDRLINNSVTAKSAAGIMIQYLIGKGYGPAVDNLIVNESKQLRLVDFADDIADDIVKQRGVFIHVNYNANFDIADCCVLPFDYCRIGKRDSNAYNGKIAVCDDWKKAKVDTVQLFDVYNPKQAVIEKQVEAAGGWPKYKGQIMFINMDSKLIYPLSRIDAVMNDCDSEAQSAVYKNRTLRRGFFGRTLVVTRPLVSGISETVWDDEAEKEVRNPEYSKAESEQERFKKTIESFIGAEDAGGVLHIMMDNPQDDLDKTIVFKDIQSNIDDKIFSYTETSVRENILIAFNNLPAGLVKTDNTLFGNSGEAIKEMKRTYWENTSKERSLVTALVNALLLKSEKYKEVKVEPIKLIDDAATNI